MCERCKDTGRLPFYRSDGSISKTSFIYCSCYNEEPEHYQDIKPSDFDYPCSDDFREHTYRYCRVADPMASTGTTETVREVRVEVQPSPRIDKEDIQLLRLTRFEMKYLRNKITALEKKKPPKSDKYIKYTE